MTKDEALDLALEALENSVDLVREDAYNAEKLYGNYPSRQGKVAGLKVLADDHEKAITAIKQALAAPVQDSTCNETLRAQGKAYPRTCKKCGLGPCIGAPKQPPAQTAPVQEPVMKKRKWVLHGSFADVAGFDEEGIPSFYWKESVTKFKSGELSVPCKGKNCGSMNGWLHSVECRAEHEAQYTTPPAQPAPVQERTDYAVHLNHCNIGECKGVCKYGDNDCPALKHADMKEKWDRPTPPAAPVQEPLSELEKDAANLLFALHDAWPYVHRHCTIESKKKAIQALMVKHGEFADLQPPAAQRQWVGLTEDELADIAMQSGAYDEQLLAFARAIEAKLRSKNNG